MTHLNKAKAVGFYLEAIFILCAMMADRLSAFLYHVGVTNKTREKIIPTKKVRPSSNQAFATEGMTDTLTRIEEWCACRNELVHALLNKKVVDQEDVLQALVLEGEECNRALQNFVKSFKSRNTLRKTFNVQ